MTTKTLTDDRIATITKRIQKAYCVFICLGTLDVIYNLSGFSENLTQGENLQGFINLFLYLLIYIGLRLKKKWLIPLVLIASAWLLVSTLLTTLQPAIDVPAFFAKVVGIMLVLFCAYQMHFFSRREVKAYFGTKETIVF
ncbi:MAG: hypothetical protein ACYC69_07455 [Thermodesulfovibrionales bacterium]